MTPMKRFLNHVRSRIAGLDPVRQFEQQEDKDIEADVVNSTDYHQEIEFGQERMGKNSANLPEAIKVIKQEIEELKTKMDSCVTCTLQGKDILLNERSQSKHPVTLNHSKIPIRITK